MEDEIEKQDGDDFYCSIQGQLSSAAITGNDFIQVTAQVLLSFTGHFGDSRAFNMDGAGTTTVLRIKDVCPNLTGLNVAGLVISKQSTKQFRASNQHAGPEKYVAGFTIRDSMTDCVNCCIWGSRDFVMESCASFQAGDVVVVRNAQALLKTTYAEMFNPVNSATFDLRVNEYQGGSVMKDVGEYSGLKRLIRSPTRPHNDYYTLSEIVEQGINLEGQCVNLLVAIKKVGSVQKLTTKAGKDIEKVEVRVFDDTLETFTLVIWEREYFDEVQNWREMSSIIFVVDARISFNRFKNCVQGSFSSKTICFTDPDINEARPLHTYAQEYELRMGGLDEHEEQDAEDEALKVYLIEELLLEQAKLSNDCSEDSQFAHSSNVIRGIMFAAITQFDIDDGSRVSTCNRCSACKYRVPTQSDDMCPNDHCSTRGDNSDFVTERSFDFFMSLSDHTGTIDRCRISGKAAEKMLGLSANDFEVLSDSDVTNLKWSWMLERCKFRFRLTPNRQFLQIRLEMCEKPQLEEFLTAARA